MPAPGGLAGYQPAGVLPCLYRLGACLVAGSAQYTITSTATLIASAPAGISGPGPVGWFYLINGSTAVYLGAVNVTSSNGAQVAASGTLTGYLFPGDQLYACTASSTSAVGVLMTGA